MTLEQYIDSINKRYKLGNATEHTFRGDLQQLIENLVPEIRATNEPKRQSCGAPDYILTKKDIPIGFIEAKDIGDKDLDGTKKTGKKEQFDRYKASLGNLIFTDYLNFHLYHDGGVYYQNHRCRNTLRSSCSAAWQFCWFHQFNQGLLHPYWSNYQKLKETGRDDGR